MTDPITWEALTTLAALDSAAFQPALKALRHIGRTNEISADAVLAINLRGFEGLGLPSLLFLPAQLAEPTEARIERYLKDEQDIARELNRLWLPNRANAILKAITADVPYQGIQLPE